jgi:tol-pal system protein YbgF
MNGRRILSLIVVSSISTGCASGKIAQLEEDLQNLRGQLTEIRSIQAENTSGLNEIRSQVSQLSGKVDETQHLAKGKTEELERTLELVSSRVPPPAGVPEDLLNLDDERISRINSAPAQLYRQALQALRAGQFVQSRTLFETFIGQNPGTAFTDNALFWSGVSFEKTNELDRAIGAYGDVYQRFPAEDFAPVALFRLADLFDKNGSGNDARVAFQKLVDDYPRSVEAGRAREILNQKKTAAPAKKRR